MAWFLIILILAAGAVVLILRQAGVTALIRRVILYEGETGLLITSGRVDGELDPGVYWVGPNSHIARLPASEQIMDVRGQEVLTQDRLGLKISVLAKWRVVDITRAFQLLNDKGGNPYSGAYQLQTRLHGPLQIAIRKLAAERTLEALLDDRDDLDAALLGMVEQDTDESGLEITEVSILDLMMAGGLKRAFAAAEEERLNGLAALERARGETAALRALANAGRIIKKNPEVAKLRLISAMEQGTGTSAILNAAELLASADSGNTDPVENKG